VAFPGRLEHVFSTVSRAVGGSREEQPACHDDSTEKEAVSMEIERGYEEWPLSEAEGSNGSASARNGRDSSI